MIHFTCLDYSSAMPRSVLNSLLFTTWQLTITLPVLNSFVWSWDVMEYSVCSCNYTKWDLLMSTNVFPCEHSFSRRLRSWTELPDSTISLPEYLGIFPCIQVQQGLEGYFIWDPGGQVTKTIWGGGGSQNKIEMKKNYCRVGGLQKKFDPVPLPIMQSNNVTMSST